MLRAVLCALSLTACAPASLTGQPAVRADDVEARVQTFTYKTVGGLEIKADVHRAAVGGADDNLRPVVVWIHGGALINGHREGVDRRVKEMVLREGWILVSIDYRLAPETRLPATVEDVEDAFRWIRKEGSERLIRAAIRYAIENNRRNVTLVHKGNIQKYTEGMFMKWGYALAKREFGDKTIGWDECGGKPPAGKILIKDAITDAFLQQILTRPDEFDVIPTCNLTGDLLSDALAAQVGGIGIAPGANINYETGHALFEATHGTAPKYAGQDKVNPGSVILSGEMMLRYMGWTDAADRIIAGLEKTIQSKVVTYDFARLMEGAREVKCSEFGTAIIANMAKL